MQYKIGDKVEITGNTGSDAGFHLYPTGAKCEVMGVSPAFPGLYELSGYADFVGGDTTQYVSPSDFKPAFESIGGGVDELRARHQPAPPDRSKVSDLQPGSTDPNDLYRFNHTENSI